MKIKLTILNFAFLTLFTTPINLNASDLNFPDTFKNELESSDLVIDYTQLDYILSRSVLEVEPSTRERAKKSSLKSSHLRSKDAYLTALEGNRFHFGAFSNENRHVFSVVKEELEHLPEKTPLNLYSKDEQLAYWLNLYNTALLNELLVIYPKNKLKTSLYGNEAILDKEIITIAGEKLTLNDIQHKILFNDYDKNPLIIYELFQGVIGVPDIRPLAFTGKNVWRALKENADRFINSNRGTHASTKHTVRVSTIYNRNSMYFDS